MPFCFSPWTNVDISPQGDISPCCKFQFDKTQPRFNVQVDSLGTYQHSNFLADLKATFVRGEWPEGCVRCKTEEQNSIESKRQLDYTRWKQYYDSYDLASDQWITASVAFGNTCNLKCITCNSYASSKWQAEQQQIYGKSFAPVKFYKKEFVEQLTQSAPELVHLDVPGGEPFLSGIKEQQNLLQHYIDTGQCERISLHYTTNATVFPDHTWWQLWQHFRSVDIQLSVDGVGKRYEYIRFPADWTQTQHNIKRYIDCQRNNIVLSVSHTVSAYNIFYLDEFFDWCAGQALPRPWLGRVHSPTHLRPTVWPQHARTMIAKHLATSSNPDVQKWADVVATTDHSEYFEEFVQRTHQHDQYRNLKFATTFGELADYVR